MRETISKHRDLVNTILADLDFIDRYGGQCQELKEDIGTSYDPDCKGVYGADQRNKVTIYYTSDVLPVKQIGKSYTEFNHRVLVKGFINFKKLGYDRPNYDVVNNLSEALRKVNRKVFIDRLDVLEGKIIRVTFRIDFKAYSNCGVELEELAALC
jgi:hypothetical protein